MMAESLIGQRFGRLVVVDEGEIIDYRKYWNCICDCGNKRIVRGGHLKDGSSKSCGCLVSEVNRKKIQKTIDSGGYTDFIKKDTIEMGTRLTAISEGKIRSDNTSGVRGVYWSKKRKSWNARLMLKGEYVFDEFFKNKDDAIKARKEAEEKYFKPILEKYK